MGGVMQAIFIQLTTGCNAKCVNCPHPFTYGKKMIRYMPEQVWGKIIQDVKEMGYTGQLGLYLHHEPLIDPYLFRKIRQVNQETKAYVVLSTNGSLLTEENRKNLVESRPHLVHVNIPSAEREQYEKMTKLSFTKVIENTKAFIAEAKGKIQVEINCPVMIGVDVEKLIRLFPEVRVETRFWANSRGGLLPGISSGGRKTRFNAERCFQPEQNFNILHDGGVVVCCQDWMHESKKDFPNVMDRSIAEIYAQVRQAKKDYKMCEKCAGEMGFVCS